MRIVSNRQYRAEGIHGHYFLNVQVENVRCFGKRQEIRLADANGTPYHWTIILGDNGVGKTSLLKSIVALAPSPKQIFREKQRMHLYPGLLDWQNDWNPQRFDGKSPSKFHAEVISAYSFKKIDRGSNVPFNLQQNHKQSRQVDFNTKIYSELGDFLCFAYGASRKMSSSSFGNEKYSTASVSLFDDQAPLINVEEFFMQADYEAKTSKSSSAREQREKVRKLLIDILPEVSDLRITKTERLGRQVEAKTPFGWIKLTEMSLGYKSLIAWVVDFASRMFHYHQTKKNPFAEPAVVLIDEVDLHLHPKWQRKIMSYLSKKFPNTQFIATAHSPLIVQAALDANLVLLKRKGSSVLIDNDPEVVKNWRIDQVLTSDLFGLESSRRPDVQAQMDVRKKLLSKQKLSAADQTELSKIEVDLGDLSEYSTRSEKEAYSAIDRVAELLQIKSAS